MRARILDTVRCIHGRPMTGRCAQCGPARVQGCDYGDCLQPAEYVARTFRPDGSESEARPLCGDVHHRASAVRYSPGPDDGWRVTEEPYTVEHVERHGVFVWEPENMYLPTSAVKLYKRKHAAERRADALNASGRAPARGYVVRLVTVRLSCIGVAW